MNKIHYISPKQLTLAEVSEIINSGKEIALSAESEKAIVRCREYLESKLATLTKPVYGINTGFGSLYNVTVEEKDLEKLQQNLVMSHACGTGAEVPQQVVKLMLLLKIQSLSYGYSAVQLQTVERLIEFYNNDILPVVYEQGSLGASGDLAPLAHLSLPLLAMGEVNYKGMRLPSEDLYKKLKWKPIVLKSKEGLALLNGTQFMSAYGVYCVLYSQRLSDLADMISAISLDAFDGRIEPFYDAVHHIRPHKGQLTTASRIRKVLQGSKLISREKQHVQDPYSFRCIPQVHGATKDTINYVLSVIQTEINSVTDNPTVFPEEDEIISAGNFHGQPLALVLDFLAIAMAELGSISERRTYKLISGQRGLPPFLVTQPGLNSGFMIPQYTAASIVSQNKQLSSPASVDTIDSSNGQEDHVSMGANAATKALRVIENVERILAIELFNAAQALEMRKPEKSSPKVEAFVASFREQVDFIEEDKVMYTEIESAIRFIREAEISI